MRFRNLLLLACFSAPRATASAAQQEHRHGQEDRPGASQPAVLTGKLVDSTWFIQSDKPPGRDQVARASANLASGIPAAVIPDDADAGKAMWVLLTNPAVLAPYAGKRVKVEGRPLPEAHALVPAAIYVADEEKWRQVQLTPPAEESATTQPRQAEHGAGYEKPDGADAARADHERHRRPDASVREDEHTHVGKHEPPAPAGDHEHAEHEHWFSFEMPPLHPLLVNLTVGLVPAAVVSDWLGRLLRRRTLKLAAWWMLLFAAVVTPFTALAGWLWFRQVGDMGHAQMAVHPWLGLSLAVALPLLAIWRGRVHARDGEPSRVYLFATTVVLLALVLQGHLGATMSFGSHGAEPGGGDVHGH